jgi:hypothetical protein
LRNLKSIEEKEEMNLEELEKKITVLEDTEAIKKLHVNYVNCLTQANYNDILDYFWDDATVDLHAGFVKGKEKILSLFQNDISKTHIGKEGPFSVHPIITVDGDNAKGSWLMYIQFASPRKLNPKPPIFVTDDAPDWLQGFYDMEYKKRNGVWKISYLKWRCRLMSPLQQSAI